MADALKWKVRLGPGNAAIQTYNSGQGPVSSPISVDEAGLKAAGSPQSVVYNEGKYITTWVYKVVGVSDPSLNIKPGDMVASILGPPFPFADQLGLKSPSQYSNMFWQAVEPANQNPNLPPGPGNDPNTPPGQQPQQPPPLPPGAVRRDQWGRAVDQWGNVVPEVANYYNQPPAAPPVAARPPLDMGLILMLGQQSEQAAERRAAREDAQARADAAAQERADRQAAADRAERRERQERLELQRLQLQAQAAAQRPYSPGPVTVELDDRPRSRRRRRSRRDDY